MIVFAVIKFVIIVLAFTQLIILLSKGYCRLPPIVLGTGNGQTIVDSFICICEAVIYACIACRRRQAQVQVHTLRFVPNQATHCTTDRTAPHLRLCEVTKSPPTDS